MNIKWIEWENSTKAYIHALYSKTKLRGFGERTAYQSSDTFHIDDKHSMVESSCLMIVDVLMYHQSLLPTKLEMQCKMDHLYSEQIGKAIFTNKSSFERLINPVSWYMVKV
jgi:hypothetical protein